MGRTSIGSGGKFDALNVKTCHDDMIHQPLKVDTSTLPKMDPLQHFGERGTTERKTTGTPSAAHNSSSREASRSTQGLTTFICPQSLPTKTRQDVRDLIPRNELRSVDTLWSEFRLAEKNSGRSRPDHTKKVSRKGNSIWNHLRKTSALATRSPRRTYFNSCMTTWKQ